MVTHFQVPLLVLEILTVVTHEYGHIIIMVTFANCTILFMDVYQTQTTLSPSCVEY